MRIHCGSRIPALILLATAAWAYPASAVAQDESALRTFFEGKRVVAIVDMPGTSDGVDLEVAVAPALDSKRYGERLKKYGASIRAGESVTVTLVKVKKDLIEFQLGGGGFGTFGDDTSTSVTMTLLPESAREKELAKQIRDEGNPRIRRDLEGELDRLKDARERENRRLTAVKVEADERKRQRVADERLHGGSRFNLHYDDAVPRGIMPMDVVAALSPYVDFSGFPGVAAPASADRRSDDGTLRKGMTRAEAERTLGSSTSATERREGTLRVVTLVFVHSNERITADFVEDVLVRYVTMSK